MLPGGGYRHLAPREGAPAARWLAASLGVVAAVLRYRLPPRHGWPAPLEDAKAALAADPNPDPNSSPNPEPNLNPQVPRQHRVERGP